MSSGNAMSRAQMLGNEPATELLLNFKVCKAGKLPLPAQESGKSGNWPVKVKFTRDLRQPRACHVSAEQLSGSTASTL